MYNGNYKERHHIIPRCVGGSNDGNNLVELSFREHYIAHMMLFIECDNIKVKCAVWRMSNSRNKGLIFPSEYNANKVWWINNIAKRKHTEAHNAKIGLANRGSTRPDLAAYNIATKKGVPRSEASIRKQSLTNMGAGNPNSKRVRNIDTGEIFLTLLDAANSVLGSKSGLCCYLRYNTDTNKTYRGFRWEYVDKK